MAAFCASKTDQPLDVAAFYSFKTELNASFLASQDSTGALLTTDWIRSLFNLGKTFWRGRAWKSAFHSVGLLGDQSSMTEELQCLGLSRQIVAPTIIPKEDDLQRNMAGSQSCTFQIFVLVAS